MATASTKSTALWVLKRLRDAGHQAYFAGGCVRDMLLGVESTDYDLASDATPDQVRQLFRRVLLVGAKFGVAMVIHHRQKVEVTTFRSDLSYHDGRRPEGVVFSDPREDALRRDFTINGLFYDPLTEEVIDYVEGQKDLRAGLVRTIGSPRQRFAEDYLRMIRAVRFTVRFGFRMDESTAEAIRQYAAHITDISGERIFEELGKMLVRESAAQAAEMLGEVRLAEAILPELFAATGLWERGLGRLRMVAQRKDTTLALAALMAELPAPAIEAICRRWGTSNELREGLCLLAGHLDDWQRSADMPLCQFKRLLAGRHFPRLLALWDAQERLLTGESKLTGQAACRARAIPDYNIAPRPLITGKHLKVLGLTEGPELGRILRAVYDAQLNEEIATRREAMERARQLLAEANGG
ncbi:MAG: CCA tRNA nucleotidyltransferase [Phycisphaerae bacterium]|jgi:poly(A) polymerase